ncbi:hypothetical protein [uncultured Fibrobacter sp.]|uniref:hypothetical protein n=1 Tax=uncultured Fibrobacter sp. TaxID=261512 RepID=UPI0025FEA47D|nr:hypothetical protein [uncultured Fibrobacter sp.]
MKKAQTVILKKAFFDKHINHKEILSNKAGRPYLSLIIEYNEKIFAIPFRTNNEKDKLPGIDFTKAVIIQESDIERHCAIDKNEWIELNKNLDTITKNFIEFIQKFKRSLKNSSFEKLPEFKFSSLQYFINDLEDLFKENSTPPADSSSGA